MENDPIESLNILAGILQQISLQMVSHTGQMSHEVVGNHVSNVLQALQQKPEQKPEEPEIIAKEL